MLEQSGVDEYDNFTGFRGRVIASSRHRLFSSWRYRFSISESLSCSTPVNSDSDSDFLSFLFGDIGTAESTYSLEAELREKAKLDFGFR